MEVLKIATAGSVDDGKSTLIGRLLYDTKSLTDDKLEAIEKTSKQKGYDYLDFSLATDGLVAEREQGITIDVAHIYFSTLKKSYIIEDTPTGVDPVLKATAKFYNPNQLRMKVKLIQMDVYIDGKKSARIDQEFKSLIKSRSEFTLPLEVQLSLKEIGLVDALLSLLGGKKYELHYLGHIKVSVRGIPVKIPVDYKREVRLRI